MTETTRNEDFGNEIKPYINTGSCRINGLPLRTTCSNCIEARMKYFGCSSSYLRAFQAHSESLSFYELLSTFVT